MDLAPTGFRPAHRVPETGVATWPPDAARPTGERLAPGAPVEVFEQASIPVVSLVGGVVGRGYGASLFVAVGGALERSGETLSWTVASGQLPPGLTLDLSRGVVRGTPTTAGTYNFTIKVTNSAGKVATSPAGGTPPTYRIIVTS